MYDITAGGNRALICVCGSLWQHQAIFDRLQKFTGMFVHPQTYDAVAAFVMGYDTACEGGVFMGFKEWLSIRLGKGANLYWPSLVLLATFPDVDVPEELIGSDPYEQRKAIDSLFNLIREFESAAAERDGLAGIFVAYREMFKRNSPA